MLSSVFRFKLPSPGEDRVLQDLLRSFAIERPRRPQAPLGCGAAASDVYGV